MRAIIRPVLHLLNPPPDPFPHGVSHIVAWCNDCGEALVTITCSRWFPEDLGQVLESWRGELAAKHGAAVHDGTAPFIHFAQAEMVEDSDPDAEADAAWRPWGGVLLGPVDGGGLTIKPIPITAYSVSAWMSPQPEPGFRTWPQLYTCAANSAAWSGMSNRRPVCPAGRCAAVEEGRQSSPCEALRSYATTHPAYGPIIACYPPGPGELLR